MCGSGSRVFAGTGSPFRRFWSGYRVASQQQILEDYPQLEPDDFLAVYAYAAELAAGSKASRG